MSDDLITIASAQLSARINPLGAELWSLTDAAGADYMTDADPAFWTGHAPVLFPIVGSLANDRLRVDGHDYAMQRHGFARKSRFERIAHGPNHLHFRLCDSAETRASYPFAFVLDMVFRVTGWQLELIATVSNPADSTLPFSFGFHPAFAWPLPGGADKAAHRVVFAEPEPQPVRRVTPVTGLLRSEAEPTPVAGRTLALDASLFADDALIWTDLNSRALIYGAPGGAVLDCRFPDLPMLGIWQVPGARYLCIEPWQGHADPVGFDGEFVAKPGVIMLPPGASRSFHYAITVTAP